MPAPANYNVSKVVCVVPTCRAECHEKFVAAWKPLFEKHKVTLVTVWDGERPKLAKVEPGEDYTAPGLEIPADWLLSSEHHDLFCRHTDACRNLGFVAAAPLLTSPDDVVVTLDDDCYPIRHGVGEPGNWSSDPIQSHIDALNRRVPLSWMNTAHDTDLYLRGVPYGVRDEAPVMLSHGVCVGVPDFDGETQLRLEENDRWQCICGCKEVVSGDGPNISIKCKECGRPAREGNRPNRIPHSLPYYVGPVPRGTLFPLSGKNVTVKRDALPYLYFAPMGVDTGVPNLHWFSDTFMGVFLKREFDRLNWACVTGYSTVQRTSRREADLSAGSTVGRGDAKKNFEEEKLGREWIERIGVWLRQPDHGVWNQIPQDSIHGEYQYFRSYSDKRNRYAELVRGILNRGNV